MLGTCSVVAYFLVSSEPLLLAGENLCSQLADFPLGEAERIPWGERAAVPIHPHPLWIGGSIDASLGYSVSV